jgi:hypothetical protein
VQILEDEKRQDKKEFMLKISEYNTTIAQLET